MTQAEAVAAAPAVLWHLAHLLQRAVDDPGEVADELYNLFSPKERATIMETCADHAVAACSRYHAAYGFTELGAARRDENGAMIGADQYETGNHCPGCGADLTAAVEAHLNQCASYNRREVRS